MAGVLPTEEDFLREMQQHDLVRWRKDVVKVGVQTGSPERRTSQLSLWQLTVMWTGAAAEKGYQ